MLNLFYENPSKNSFKFQSEVIDTIWKAFNENREKKLIISERSVHSARYIFANVLKKNKYLTPKEYDTISESYNRKTLNLTLLASNLDDDYLPDELYSKYTNISMFFLI